MEAAETCNIKAYQRKTYFVLLYLDLTAIDEPELAVNWNQCTEWPILS